jgi:hypothetical protein
MTSSGGMTDGIVSTRHFIHHAYPTTGFSFGALDRLGACRWRLLDPRFRTCCGMPHRFDLGDVECVGVISILITDSRFLR